MSAFVVSRHHLNTLFTALLHYQPDTAPVTWQTRDGQVQTLTRDNAMAVGQLLRNENVDSCNHRHPDETLERKHKYTYFPNPVNAKKMPEPAAVLRYLACLECQSCEHPAWFDSEAHAFCEAATDVLVRLLPGYAESTSGDFEQVDDLIVSSMLTGTIRHHTDHLTGPLHWYEPDGKRHHFLRETNAPEVGEALWAVIGGEGEFTFRPGLEYRSAADMLRLLDRLRELAVARGPWADNPARHFWLALRHRMISAQPGYAIAWHVGDPL